MVTEKCLFVLDDWRPQKLDVAAMRAAFESAAALDEGLRVLDNEAQALESSLRSLVELRTSQVDRWIGVEGFAFFAAASLAEPCAKAFERLRGITNGHEDASGFRVLPAMLGFFILFSWIFRALMQRDDPLGKK